MKYSKFVSEREDIKKFEYFLVTILYESSHLIIES